METISAHLPFLAGSDTNYPVVTTYRVWFYDSDSGALLNASGDILTEIARGLFTLSLTETRSAALYRGDVRNASGLVLTSGWLEDGSSELKERTPNVSASISEDDIASIVSAVQATPPFNSATSRTSKTVVRSDRWTESWTLTPPVGYSRIAWALKRNEADSDSQALLIVDSENGITRINGGSPSSEQAAQGSLSYSSGSITLTVESEVTTLIPSGTFLEGIKSFPARKHLRNLVPFRVQESIVDDVSEE